MPSSTLKDMKCKLGKFAPSDQRVYEAQSWPVVHCNDGFVYDFQRTRDQAFSTLYESCYTGKALDEMVLRIPIGMFSASRYNLKEVVDEYGRLAVPRCAHCNGTSYYKCERTECRLPICERCASICWACMNIVCDGTCWAHHYETECTVEKITHHGVTVASGCKAAMANGHP